MSSHPLLKRWLAYMESKRAPEDLRALLADNAVFHSPVVHTPQEGKEKAFAYLHAASVRPGLCCVGRATRRADSCRFVLPWAHWSNRPLDKH